MNHTNQPTEHQEILKRFDLPALALLPTDPPPLNTIFTCTEATRQITAAATYQEAWTQYQAAIKRCTIRTGQDMLQRAIMARRDHPMRGR